MSPYIIYSKLILKTEYRPPYNRKVCNYKLAETDFIKRAIADCDWPSLFLGKHVHQQAEILRETFLNIFHNYIRNKFISCGDKDPPWINEEFKSLIHRKNYRYQRQRKSSSIDNISWNLLIKCCKFFQIEIWWTPC